MTTRVFGAGVGGGGWVSGAEPRGEMTGNDRERLKVRTMPLRVRTAPMIRGISGDFFGMIDAGFRVIVTERVNSQGEGWGVGVMKFLGEMISGATGRPEQSRHSMEPNL